MKIRSNNIPWSLTKNGDYTQNALLIMTLHFNVAMAKWLWIGTLITPK